ncbi:phosphomannomutase [Bacillus phage SP-15]|uniref:Phosphomannomutase n=1 Tax=Bacillus phage SP-15 TaxID=1792032 RepID=A0A127AWJ1_9CAUD|nr:phosphomannomutase [Bacillus phage SP-15]AMM44953.1 phosphomannomutase [Bacillus phage SP-15]
MSIVRMYDIRGIYGKELTDDYAYNLGIRLVNYLNSVSQSPTLEVLVGYDARRSSPALHDKLVEAISKAGANVVSVGMTTSGVISTLDKMEKPDASVMITASHNPPEYNGFKIIVNGQALYGDLLAEVANYSDIVFSGVDRGSIGSYPELINNLYVPAIVREFKNRQSEIDIINTLELAIDCANGSAGPVLQDVLDRLGLNIELTLKEPDGSFPVHPPDPSKEDNWVHIKSHYLDTKMLFMIDGDGDRVGVMTNEGTLLKGDKVLSIIAEASSSRAMDNTILLDVKSSELVREHIKSLGYRVRYHQTGHSLIKKSMNGDKLIAMAGEESGHLYIRDEFFGVDDAVYNLLRFLFDSVKLGAHANLESYLNSRMPRTYTLSLKFNVSDNLKPKVMERVAQKVVDYAESLAGEVITIDGVRANFHEGWFILRQSNTEPYIGANIETYEEDKLGDIRKVLSDLVTEAIAKEEELSGPVKSK